MLTLVMIGSRPVFRRIKRILKWAIESTEQTNPYNSIQVPKADKGHKATCSSRCVSMATNWTMCLHDKAFVWHWEKAKSAEIISPLQLMANKWLVRRFKLTCGLKWNHSRIKSATGKLRKTLPQPHFEMFEKLFLYAALTFLRFHLYKESRWHQPITANINFRHIQDHLGRTLSQKLCKLEHKLALPTIKQGQRRN